MYGEIGLTPEAFYGLTLHEFRQTLRGYQERMNMELAQLRWTVWHTAALQRVKSLPSFGAFVGLSKSEKKAMSREEQDAQLASLQDLFAAPPAPGKEGDDEWPSPKS